MHTSGAAAAAVLLAAAAVGARCDPAGRDRTGAPAAAASALRASQTSWQQLNLHTKQQAGRMRVPGTSHLAAALMLLVAAAQQVRVLQMSMHLLQRELLQTLQQGPQQTLRQVLQPTLQ